MFERDGYLDARVADISAAARVAHDLYTYFDSKEDIFREIVETVADDVYAALDALEGSAAQRISAANVRHVGAYEQHTRPCSA